MSHHTSFSLAALCTAGGLIGYSRTRSLPSLVAGVTLGGLYGLTGYLILNNKDNGYALGTFTSGVLVGAMVPRAAKTRKPVPIAMSVIGLAGLAYHSKKLFEELYGV